MRTKTNRWTKEEDEYLLNNIGKMPRQEIADHLGRTMLSIQSRIWVKGYSIYCNQAQKEMVLNLYKQMTAKEVAKLTGLSVDSVYKIAQRYKIKKHEYYNKELRYENSRVYKLLNGII